MRQRGHRGTLLAIVLLYMTTAAADGCLDFKWDVGRERALFRSDAKPLLAATSAATAPRLALDQLYRLQLVDQGTVQFPTVPGRAYTGGNYAGLATVVVPADGTYRIAVDVPLWIDVAAGRSRVVSNDYQGQRDCAAPHKIVEFVLKGGTPLVLQLSGADTDAVQVTVTASPARVH